MIKPTIHLNGTSPERLFEDYHNAYRAVNAAIEALANVEFHPRDYYPQDDKVFELARAQRVEQFTKLREIRDELRDVAEYVSNFRK
jgi:hypothetical protein